MLPLINPSLFSRLGLRATFAGLQAFKSAFGYQRYKGSGLGYRLVLASAIPGLVGSDPAPGFYANSIQDVGREGHAYAFISSPFSLSPEAQQAVRDMKAGVVPLMVLAFAAGDGTLIRPADQMQTFASDYAYTAAMIKAGTIPENALVQLGSSQIRMEDVQVTEKNGDLEVRARAVTTDAHVFNGVADWTLTLKADGTASVQYSGTGKAALCGLDAANNAVAGPLWQTTSEKAIALVEAMGKDRDVFDKAASPTDLRPVIEGRLTLGDRVTERFLRVLDVTSRPYIALRESHPECFAGEPIQPGKNSASMIDDTMSKPDLSAADVVSDDERAAIASDAQAIETFGRVPDPLDASKIFIFTGDGGGALLGDPPSSEGDPNGPGTGDPSSPIDPPNPPDPPDPPDPVDPHESGDEH